MNLAGLIPPPLRDERGLAFAAALGLSYALDPWQASPLKVEAAADEVLFALAAQFDVTGPVWQAMQTRKQKEGFIKSALAMQRKRGTPWAVEESMRLLGYTDAYVIDRARILRYDGRATHSGTHIFEAPVQATKHYDGIELHDGYAAFGPLTEDKWGTYGIRLFMAHDSRPFALLDSQQAAIVAAHWAPLRCTLADWTVRHVVESRAPDPASEAANTTAIALRASNGATQEIAAHALPSGSACLRWCIATKSIALQNVVALALKTANGTMTPFQQMPIVELSRCITYEICWTLAPA
jgi:hypothetical protein